MSRKEYQAKWRANQKAQGNCLWCKEKALPGRSLCEKHYAENTKPEKHAYLKHWRKSRREKGLCAGSAACVQTPVEGKTLCQQHLDEEKEKARIQREAKRVNGICLNCKSPAAPGKTYCKQHCKQIREESSRLRAERREKGICEDCGKNPAVSNERAKRAYCVACYLKTTARSRFKSTAKWTDLAEVFERQNKCPYTGLPLSLGVNTSIDHITPKSAGGTDDIGNLQWVYHDWPFDVNAMKGSMTADKFRDAVRVLYEWMWKSA